MTFEALNERYQSLASMVTSGMDSCAAGHAQSGQTEKIECGFPQGTLVLTTYSSVGELQAARKRRLNTAEGTIVSDVESGAYYRFDPTTADPTEHGAPILYWDSQAGVQSAELTGGTGVKADQLDPAFVAVSATVTPPDGPVDVAVQDFNSLFTVINCTRIPTEIGGETEESKCKRSGRNTWVGKFAKVNDLRQYRQNAKTLAGQDDDLVVDYWYNDDNSNGQQDEDEPEQGKIYGYIEEQDGGTNYGVLYIDDLDCRCYLQMYDKGQGDPEKLYNLDFRERVASAWSRGLRCGARRAPLVEVRGRLRPSLETEATSYGTSRVSARKGDSDWSGLTGRSDAPAPRLLRAMITIEVSSPPI